MDQINNVFNLNYMEKSSLSLSKAVLLFYLLIANNYTNKLLSGQITEFIEKNRYAQHVIGFITMLVIINIFAGVTDPVIATLYSAVAYLLFIITTKLDLSWNLLIIGLMILAFLYESTMMDKEVRSETDQALQEEDKEKIRQRHNKVKSMVVVAILIIAVI